VKRRLRDSSRNATAIRASRAIAQAAFHRSASSAFWPNRAVGRKRAKKWHWKN